MSNKKTASRCCNIREAEEKRNIPIIRGMKGKINMDIRLKSIHLENFKCHGNLTLDFGGQNASIYGDNAVGKTSVYDALTWLLFGKDSAGNGEKNVEIKPLATDGSVRDHQAITEVEAVLLADGEEIALKRTYQEVWSTKRGSSEPTYDGNTSDYFVNAVPCKANAYKSKVAELVDEDRFRLLTMVSYFPAVLSWQKRREVLFSLFGTMDDKTIMTTDDRFGPLLDAMGKLPLDDFKKVIQQKRKGFMGTRNEVPARISECEKTIADLSQLDFDGAEAEMGLLNARLDSLNRELVGIERNTEADSKRMELREAQLAMNQLEADNRAYRQQQMVSEVRSTAVLEAEVRQRGNILASAKRARTVRDLEVMRCGDDIERARAEWKKVNGEKFTGSVCPCCGQKLPAAKLVEANTAFEKDKQERLSGLVAKANQAKESMVQLEKEVKESDEYIRQLESEIAELNGKIAEIKAAPVPIVEDMKDYTQKQEEIAQWMARGREELNRMESGISSSAADVKRRISQTKAEIQQYSVIAGKRSAYQYAQERITELREEAQAAADKLNELDKLLYLMEEFSRYKASFVEYRINSRFRLAKFRLFREQANGGVEDRCDVVFDGVPYTGLNNGMKINVGIDVINTLSRAYGVTVPLFVDNAESVTQLEKTDCQLVRLVVSEADKTLRFEKG